MDVSNVLSDSVKVTIRQKDKSCYVELATDTLHHQMCGCKLIGYLN